MYGRILITMLLLLALAGGATAQGMEDKTIPYRFVSTDNACDDDWFYAGLSWQAPEKWPHNYRISWKRVSDDRDWPDKKVDRKGARGNDYVRAVDLGPVEGGMNAGYVFPRMKLACGEGLRIRIRARYKGEKNGPWLYWWIVRTAWR